MLGTLGRQRGGAHLRGPGPLRTVQRRQRRRRGRSGDPVEGGRPAGARPVDAARRSAVVDPVSARRSPTSGSAGTRAGRSPRYQADHYMPAMQDDRLVGALLAGLPTPPPPDVRAGARVHRFDRQRDLGSVGLRPGSERRRVGIRNVPARTEERRRSPSVFAITACGRRASCSRTTRASWRSAKRRRWPASTRSSSASGRPTTSG